MSLNNVRGKPQFAQGLNGVIPIYPIQIKNYDKFQTYNRFLYISKEHFSNSEYPLLMLIIANFKALDLTYENLVNQLCKLFSLITRHDVVFGEVNGIEGFVIIKRMQVNKKIIELYELISTYNYEQVREIVMNQNLMFEQKVYKNKIVQEWAELAIKEKMKNQPKIGIEEMLTTVSVLTGKHYSDLDCYTIYQVYSDFYRIRKDKNYNTAILAKCQGEDMELEDFAEYLDLYKNPYDSLFVSNDKLNKFEK